MYERGNRRRFECLGLADCDHSRGIRFLHSNEFQDNSNLISLKSLLTIGGVVKATERESISLYFNSKQMAHWLSRQSTVCRRLSWYFWDLQ